MKYLSQPLVKMYFRSFLGVSSLFLLLFLLFALVRGGVAAAMVLPFDESGASAAGQGLLMGEASPEHDTTGTTGTSVCEGSGFVGQSQLYLPLVTSNASNNSHAAASLATNERNQQAIHPLRRVAEAGDKSLKLKVAYLYDADMATGEAFGALLQAEGLQIYLLSLGEVAEAEFSACDLLLLGSDTGSWADESTRNAVLDSERSIMALGEGGLNFLDAAGLLGGIASASANATTVEATLRGQSAYEFPNAIALADETVQLYSSASETRVLEISNPLADGIEIGRLPERGHVAIVQLQERFLLWGFSDAPAQMSEAGQALFVNLLGFQGQALQLPLRLRHFTPQAGIEQALIDELASTSEPNLHAYVQFKPAPDDPACDEFSNLTPQGVTVLTYFWGQTYIASVTPEFDAADPLLATCVRWMGRILPEDKVMPKVLANQFEAWADNGDGTVNLLVSFFPDVPDSEASDILATQVSSQTPFGMQTWVVVMEKSNVSALSENDRVRWIEEGPPPILPTNDVARQELFVDELQEASIVGNDITYNGLDGTGIAVGVWDLGFDNDHPDFAGRVLVESGGEDAHGTHVSGIIGASGANSLDQGGTPFEWRGMAPKVDFAFYDLDAGFTPATVNEALNTYNIKVSNHSYKVICEGRYDLVAQAIDSVLRGSFNYEGSNLRAHPAIWAAGNEGGTRQYCADDETGYHSITSPGKNNLTVGAVSRNNDYRLLLFSSRGPTYDGRLKPEVMATGDMYSTVPDGGYDSNSGTSMAAPAVTGIAALALEQYGITYGTTEPLPATVKGLLINYATDLVNDPDEPDYEPYNFDEPDTGSPLIYHQGPDFSTGYGVVHARRTVDAVRHKAALEGQLNDANQVDEYTIEVLPSRQELRFTLVWDDPSADPALADSAIHLVNDLELLLIDPNGGLHYPWVLNPPPCQCKLHRCRYYGCLSWRR